MTLKVYGDDRAVASAAVARPAGSTRPIAVRITDMLGEDVLVTEIRG